MATHDKSTLDRIEDAISKLAASQIHVTEKLEDLLLRVANLEQTSTNTHSPSSSSANPSPANTNNPQKMKLDVPRFDGSDPSGWIFKIQQFFAYHSTPDSERLTIASFYMEGPALAWFQWLMRNHQLTTWQSFLEALDVRFSHSPYEDPTGLLFKLTQIGTVTEYLTQFEAIANRIVGLSLSLLLSCFISGLDPDIRREVKMLQPLTMVHAVGLARLQEEKLADTRRPSRHRATPSPQPYFPPNPPTIPLSSPPPPTLPLLPPPPKPPPIPLKHLTPTEMASHRERGLCFNCVKKFMRGHHCASRFFVLIADSEPPDNTPQPNLSPTHPDPNLNPQPDDPTQPKPPQAQISFYALSGHSASETLRLLGHIGCQPVVILVDGGSTHNFVQARLVRHLGLTATPTPPLRVLVGNKNELECHLLSSATSIRIQGHTFKTDLHVLPISGANVVLGVHWLKSLGPILTDYNTLTMKFVHNGIIIELSGDSSSELQAISPPQLRHMLHTDGDSEFFHIRVDTSIPDTPHTPPEIQSLINQFSPLFQTPQTLPPSRPTNHYIHPHPSATPVNVKPYRYPFSQK